MAAGSLESGREGTWIFFCFFLGGGRVREVAEVGGRRRRFFVCVCESEKEREREKEREKEREEKAETKVGGKKTSREREREEGNDELSIRSGGDGKERERFHPSPSFRRRCSRISLACTGQCRKIAG